MVGWHHQLNGHELEKTQGDYEVLFDHFQFAMDLTFQVPIQYCSLQHQTLLPSPVTSTTGYCFCFGSIPSFFLELFFHSSPVAYWAPTNLKIGCVSFSVLSFSFSQCLWGSQGKNNEVFCHFPSPVDHILSELSIMTRLPWVALHGMALSFFELGKAVIHVIRLVSFL